MGKKTFRLPCAPPSQITGRIGRMGEGRFRLPCPPFLLLKYLGDWEEWGKGHSDSPVLLHGGREVQTPMPSLPLS